MRKTVLLSVLALLGGGLLGEGAAYAQTPHACDATVAGPFIVTSGRPANAQWCLPSTVVVDGVEIPMRLGGFTVQVDAGLASDVGKPVSGVPSTVSKLQLYAWQMPAGTAKGNHTLTITPWNFVLNADGTETTTRQTGGALVIPFVVSDPFQTAAPPTPSKGRVIK